MPEIDSHQLFTLPSGLRVMAVERPYGKTFAAALSYRVGCFDDPADAPGLTHFCEHLAFRGANRQIAEELAEQGVHVNAHTAWEYTQFNATGHVDHYERSLGLFVSVPPTAVA